MFNKHVLDTLKNNTRMDPFNSYGEHVKMTGGIRYGLHPTPELDFQPDNLYTGRERYQDIKPRMVGGSCSGGRLEAYSGGSTKSIGKALSKGLKKVGKVIVPMATDVGKNIVKNIATKQGQAYIEKQLAKYALPAAETALMVAAGRSGGGDKRTSRAILVRKIMKEHGVSLPEASKYIKDNGISY